MATYLEINGIQLSIKEIAEKFGITDKVIRPALCQEVPAGMLRAIADDNEPFRGMDLELVLPKKADTQPILLARADQPDPDGEAEKPTVYFYGRGDEYVAFMPVDIRPDSEVEEEPEDTRITISGDPGDNVQVFAENQYLSFINHPDPKTAECLPF